MPATASLALTPFIELAAALMLGAVIGLERGWRERARQEGSRVAGLRTFALLGLAGGVLGVLAQSLGPWPAASGVLGLTLLAVVAYRENVRTHGSLSATTAVAMLLTTVLGLLAGIGQPVLAIGAAVVVAVLLDLKPTLHRWLRLLEQRELSAALQLLALSAVVLPLLPDAGYGPYGALNPYQLWWAVVLIATLSLAGHFAVRIAGAQRGIFWTGVLGGLASSTATTLALARRTQAQPALRDAATAGILAANAMMFLRITVIVTAFQPALAGRLGAPMVAAAAMLLATAAWYWRRRQAADGAPSDGGTGDPFDLSTALGFGLLLGVLAVASQAARNWLGEPGLYAVAFASGLVDVDAIVLTVMRMVRATSLAEPAAMVAMALAAGANMLVKAAITTATGGMLLGRRVAVGYGLCLLAAAAAAWLL